MLYDNVETDWTVEQEIPLDAEVSSIELQNLQMDYNAVTEVSAELPEPLPDSVPSARFQSWPRTPGVGAAYEHPVDPRVLGTNRGHLGLWEEAALRLVSQNTTASTQRTGSIVGFSGDAIKFYPVSDRPIRLDLIV